MAEPERYSVSDLSWLDLSPLSEEGRKKPETFVSATDTGSIAGCWLAFDSPTPVALEPIEPVYQDIIGKLLMMHVLPDQINKRMRVSFSGSIHNIATHHEGQTAHMNCNFTTNATDVEEVLALLNVSPGVHELHGVDWVKDFEGGRVTLLSGTNMTKCPNPLCSQDWRNDWRIVLYANTYFDKKP